MGSDAKCTPWTGVCFAAMQELAVDMVIEGYMNGVFPMVDPDSGDLEWYFPDPRAILELDAFHVPRSLARTIRSGRFEVRTDTCFDEVLAACGEPSTGREDTWIDQRIAIACGQLHGLGLAHSVEAWLEGRLVGGLYGVRLGGAFFGESMFSRPDAGGRDASKVCLVWLVDHLRAIGASLLDVQFMTEHLQRFGASEIGADEYLARLREATGLECRWTPHSAPPRAGELPRSG